MSYTLEQFTVADLKAILATLPDTTPIVITWEGSMCAPQQVTLTRWDDRVRLVLDADDYHYQPSSDWPILVNLDEVYEP